MRDTARTAFKTWNEAHEHAQWCADFTKRDYGIERIGRQYIVRPLPNPENRYGYDLRCEVVPPMQRGEQ